MARFRSLGAVSLLLSVSLSPAWAQHAQGQNPNLPDQHAQIEQDMQHTQQKARQKKRFEDIQRDSQKLLELATELKQYVDKSGEDILSLEVLRKAEEMEKLARQVKNNMRGE
jgi:hypothetical protein